MSFDAGSIEATLDVDRSPFQTGLDQAKADGQEFADKTFTATLGLDDGTAKADLDEFKTDLSSVGTDTETAKVSVNTGTSVEDVGAVKTALDSVDGDDAKAKVDVSGTTEAVGEVEILKTDLDELGSKTVKPNVDSSGLKEAKTDGDALGVTLDNVVQKALDSGAAFEDSAGKLHAANGEYTSAESLLRKVSDAGGDAETALKDMGQAAEDASGGGGGGSSGGLSSFVNGIGQVVTSISPMTLLIVAVAPALIPLAAAATAAGIGLAGMAIAGGAAIGAFGLAALPVFSQVSTAVTNITADQAKLNSALTDTQKSTAYLKLQSDLAGLSPMVRTVTLAVLDAKQAFNDWDAQFQPQILEVFNSALADFKPLLNDITPLVTAGASAVNQFFKAVGGVANSSGFQHFIMFLGSEAGPAISTITTAMINFGKGIASALEASPNLISDVEGAIVGISKAFANFTKSKDFTDFLDYIQKNGPAIVGDVQKIATGIGHFVTVIAPLGMVVLNYVADIIQAVGKIGTLVNALAAFFTNTIPHAISVTSGAFTTGFQAVHNIVNTTWHAIDNDFVIPLADFFTNTVPHAVSVFSGAFTTGFQAVHNIFNTTWHAIDNDFVQPLTNFFENTIPHTVSDFVGFFTAIPGQVDHVWTDVVNALHTAWSDVASWVNTNLIQPVVNFFTGIPGLVAHVWTDVVTAIEGAWNAIAGWVNTNVVQPVVNFFTGIPGAVSGAWSTVVTDLQGAWNSIAGWVNSNVIQPVVSFFTGIPGQVSNVGSQVWTDFTSGLSTIASWVTDNVVTPVVTEITNLPSQIGNIGGKIVSGIADGIRNAAGDLSKAVSDIIPHGTIHIGPVSIPYAQGGIVAGPTNALIGEDGAEAILPLTKPARMVQILSQILPTLGAGVTSSVPQLPLSGFGGNVDHPSAGTAGTTVLVYTPTYNIPISGSMDEQTLAKLQAMLDEHGADVIEEIARFLAPEQVS